MMISSFKFWVLKTLFKNQNEIIEVPCRRPFKSIEIWNCDVISIEEVPIARSRITLDRRDRKMQLIASLRWFSLENYQFDGVVVEHDKVIGA